MGRSVFSPADILLPHEADLSTWSVIACDQYTSQPDYWNGIEREVGGAPSALRLILPECFLGTPEEPARVREAGEKEKKKEET